MHGGEAMSKTVGLKSAVISSVVCILVLLAVAPAAFSQFTSGFSGVVVEQSGAAVPSAKVTITNQATRVSETSTSSDSGVFRISSLAEGIYTVEIEGKGFKAWTQ